LFGYINIKKLNTAMEIQKAIVNRRAIYPKQMSGESIDNETIERMLELANWAPTHKRTEPWRFKVYSGNAMNLLLDKCKELYVKQTTADKFNSEKLMNLDERKRQVSHIIAIGMQRNEAALPEFEEIAAVSMAVQNMWLYLANTQKYGGYWSTPSYALSTEFANFLDLDENEKCLGLFLIGTIAEPDNVPAGQRGDWRDKVKFKEV